MRNHLIHTLIAIFCVTMFAASTVWADGASDSQDKQVSGDKKDKEKKKEKKKGKKKGKKK